MGGRLSRALGMDALDFSDIDPFSCALPKVLPSLDVEGIAMHIRKARPRVLVLAGAGLSTASGIPDFRMPGTGLYAKLAARGETAPERAFARDVFDSDPSRLYAALAAIWSEDTEHAPIPAVAHHFLAMLDAHGLLLRVYTQNVDGLERMAGIAADKIIQAHGTLDSAFVEAADGSRVEVPIHELRSAVCNGRDGSGGWRALADAYGGFARPAVTLFGEQLPVQFHQMALNDMANCELLLIMGTSLLVEPVASLVNGIDVNVPRLVLNRTRLETQPSAAALRAAEFVGTCEAALNTTLHFGESNHRNVELLGDCDTGCRQLARSLGSDWAQELEARVSTTCRSSL